MTEKERRIRNEKACRGYTFDKTGIIKNKSGVIIHARKAGNMPSITIRDESGNRITMNPAKVIYEKYSGEEILPNECIGFKDGDCLNIAFENLYKRKRLKVVNQQNKIFSKDVADKIKKEYDSAPKSVNQYNRPEGAVSQRSLAKKYGCSIYIIEQIVHGKYMKGEEDGAE